VNVVSVRGSSGRLTRSELQKTGYVPEDNMEFKDSQNISGKKLSLIMVYTLTLSLK
jgi:hypothetical protein